MERIWLKQIREQSNMTQAEVANLAKISESYYYMIETGDRRPSVDVAQSIAYVLKFDWQLFFPNKNNESTQENPA